MICMTQSNEHQTLTFDCSYLKRNRVDFKSEFQSRHTIVFLQLKCTLARSINFIQ